MSLMTQKDIYLNISQIAYRQNEKILPYISSKPEPCFFKGILIMRFSWSCLCEKQKTVEWTNLREQELNTCQKTSSSNQHSAFEVVR
jgi:hypothetical protein